MIHYYYKKKNFIEELEFRFALREIADLRYTQIAEYIEMKEREKKGLETATQI